jgi:O-antigen ligase/polysaccharide polymerase Wzy-like membrane protein
MSAQAAVRAPRAGGRTRAGAVAAGALLAGPTVLAFFSGGYFDVPRLWAALAAWTLLLAVVLLAPHPLPRPLPARLALAGLALFAVLAFVSAWWAPRRGPAFDDAGRDLLYLAALAAATALLRGRVARAVEPALIAGATLVIGYGLSERVLPGLVTLSHSRTALGRLEQPLTYWNATGALAAIGLVLAARAIGDAARPAGLRAAAAAAAVPLGAGVALSYSRGALLAALAGLVVLAALCPGRGALRAMAIAPAAALAAGVVVSLPGGVRALEGDLPRRELEGAVVLVALLALMAAAALAARRWAPPRADSATWRPPAGAAAALVAVLVGLMLLGAALDRGPRTGTPQAGATASRLASTQSNRFAYWRVALDGFADHPLRGLGGGGFADLWLQKRTVRDPARDAHSLYIETAAEYGLLGLAALGLTLGGVAVSARRAYARAPSLTAGAIAGLATWAVHAGVDWDWEMPALTLVAMLLAGLVLAASDDDAPRWRTGPRLALGLGAAALLAVVAVGLRAATLTEKGRGLLPTAAQPVTDARFDQARSALQRAQRLTPDPEPEQLEAILVVFRGRIDESIRLLDDVVAKEPRNAVAWQLLAGALERTHSPRAAAAHARASALAPPPVGAPR